MAIPKIGNYGLGRSQQDNTTFVEVGGVMIYFSYKTPVAYRNGDGLVVRENEWGTTTGKHLNWIDRGDKKARISGGQFERQLEEVTA